MDAELVKQQIPEQGQKNLQTRERLEIVLVGGSGRGAAELIKQQIPGQGQKNLQTRERL